VTLELAAKQGVDDVTTQDMAKAMGVTQGAVFRHFLSKDAIWLAVMQWVRDRLMGRAGPRRRQGARSAGRAAAHVFRANRLHCSHPRFRAC